MKRRSCIALLLATSVSLLVPFPDRIRPLFAALQTFVIPGLAFVGLLWNRGRLRVDDLFLSLALSPVLFVLATLAAGIVMPVPRAAEAAAWFWYAALAVSLLAGRSAREPAAGPPGESRPLEVPRSVVLLSLAYGAVVLGAYAFNGYLMWRSDAWYHASVTAEILERGTPPGEPWIAGIPIRYMWIYHLFAASFMRLSGLPLLSAIGALNVASAAAFPYLVGRFVSSLTGDRRTVFLATALTVAGFESASWVLWPVAFGRAFFGEVTGLAEIARAIEPPPLDWRVIYALHPYGTWMANLTDKFLTVTAFGYSLCLFTLTLGVSCSRAARSASTAGLFALATVAAAGAFLFHVITGTLLIGACIVAGVLSWIYARVRGQAGSERRDRLVPAAAALAAAVACIPYFLSLRAGGGAGEGGVGIAFVPTTALTILAPLVLLAVPSWRAVRRLLAGRDPAAGMAGWWILCLLVPCLFVALPSVNSSKLVFPLFLAVGPLVFIEAVSLARSNRRRRWALVSWLILLYLPPPLITLGGFLASRPIGPDEQIRAGASREDELFRWIRENTSTTAVIAEPGRTYLMPVFAGRRNLASQGGVLDVVGYGGPRVRRYQALADSLYAPGGIGPETAAMIGGSGLDLYVIVRRPGAYPEAEGGMKLLDHPAFRKVFETEGTV
ncbi:MAG: hypothetical protein PHQ19_06715, partial [Candidatus Krumholzibacteria bacterium]|nr:hypothetical protein [Candidatus Krumholzibacteria bacterium]